MDQDNIFLKTEGDNWFKRNVNSIINIQKKDLIIEIIQLYKLNPKKVLEIGASNGWRLNEIHKLFGSSCTAVEPSELALKDGEERYPHIEFHRALASELPFDGTKKFDLIILNFVFHWIGRDKLLNSINEIDRVLMDNGLLIIGDFLPDFPNKVKYHHISDEEVWTYKQDYAKIFTSSNLYRLIGFFTGHHQTKEMDPSIDSNNRISISLLRKDLNSYPEQKIDINR